jgi:RHS repeat-associated protein
MNLGYTGKAYDAATGLYDYGYRDYAPSAARFTTEDPIRDGSNWFAYVNNDPVNYIDLWGLEKNTTVRDVLTAVTNPIGAIFVLNNKNDVEAYIRNNYGLLSKGQNLTGHNDRIDAFRHTAWNALNAKDLGANEAKRFGDAHEARGDQPDDERMMDLTNNEIGRRLGPENSHLSDNEIFEIVISELERENSKLVKDVPDGGPSTYKYGDGYGSDPCKK